MVFYAAAQAFLEQDQYIIREEDNIIDVCVFLVGRIEREVKVNLYTGNGSARGMIGRYMGDETMGLH